MILLRLQAGQRGKGVTERVPRGGVVGGGGHWSHGVAGQIRPI
jgi:hypothetical protein